MRAGEKFCPGILHAVPAKDGLLVRIRVPGGLMEASQLRVVADLSRRFADDTVEITSRANLQVRALQPQDLAEVVGELRAVGLFPSETHDRVRNIVASPFAGLEGDERIDTREMVRELDRRLQAESVFAGLSPKFTFGFQGGERRYSHDVEDLSLERCEDASRMLLLIDGVSTGHCVETASAVECMLEGARVSLRLAQESGVVVRTRRLGGIDRIVAALGRFLTPCFELRRAPEFVEVVAGGWPASRTAHVNLVPSVPLGRLSSQQACEVASVAGEWGADLRLAPWRGVVLGSIPAVASAEVRERLASVGLACDSRDGFSGVAACAGITGCDASLADVRSDAAVIARRLSGKGIVAGWTVNLSGCEKQCARRHGASAELIAGDGGYLLKIDGQMVEANCSREGAIDAITALHAQKVFEVAAG